MGPEVSSRGGQGNIGAVDIHEIHEEEERPVRVGPPGLVAPTDAVQQLLGVADQLRRQAAVRLGQLLGDRQPDAMGQPQDRAAQRRVVHRRQRAHLVVAELLDIIIEPAPDAVGGVAHPGVAHQAGGGVAVGGEVLGQRGRRPEVGAIDPGAVLERPEAREHGHVRGQGERGGRSRHLERDPLPGPALELGRRPPRIAVDAHVVGADGVHDDPEQVRGPRRGPGPGPLVRMGDPVPLP